MLLRMPLEDLRSGLGTKLTLYGVSICLLLCNLETCIYHASQPLTMQAVIKIVDIVTPGSPS